MIATHHQETGSLLDIGTMAARYRVSLRTLRFYENQGLLSPTRQDGKRLYTRRDCIRLEIILKGKKLGLSLRSIGVLIRDKNLLESFSDGPAINTFTTCQLETQLEVMQKQRQDVEYTIEELESEIKKRQM